MKNLKNILRLFSCKLLLVFFFVFIQNWLALSIQVVILIDMQTMIESKNLNHRKYAYSGPMSFYPFNKGVYVAKRLAKNHGSYWNGNLSPLEMVDEGME